MPTYNSSRQLFILLTNSKIFDYRLISNEAVQINVIVMVYLFHCCLIVHDNYSSV